MSGEFLKQILKLNYGFEFKIFTLKNSWGYFFKIIINYLPIKLPLLLGT